MKFAMKPHKSSKNGRGTPYTRTKPSIVRNLDRKLTTAGPKDAASMATQESGGSPSQVKLCSIFVSTENILSSKEISVIKNRWKSIQIPIFIAGRITQDRSARGGGGGVNFLGYNLQSKPFTAVEN